MNGKCGCRRIICAALAVVFFTVSCGHVNRPLPVAELEPGEFEGRYTIRTVDYRTLEVSRFTVVGDTLIVEELRPADDEFGFHSTVTLPHRVPLDQVREIVVAHDATPPTWVIFLGVAAVGWIVLLLYLHAALSDTS